MIYVMGWIGHDRRSATSWGRQGEKHLAHGQELIGIEKIKTGLVGSPPESFRFRCGPKAHLPS